MHDCENYNIVNEDELNVFDQLKFNMKHTIRTIVVYTTNTTIKPIKPHSSQYGL